MARDIGHSAAEIYLQFLLYSKQDFFKIIRKYYNTMGRLLSKFF